MTLTLSKGNFHCKTCKLTFEGEYKPQQRPRKSCPKCHKMVGMTPKKPPKKPKKPKRKEPIENLVDKNLLDKAKLKKMSIKAKLKLVGEMALDDYILNGNEARILAKSMDILSKEEFIYQGEIDHGIYWTSDTPPYKRPEFMYPHQVEAMNLMDLAHLLWIASRQLGGKTTATLLKDFEDMLIHPNYTVALVAPTVPLAREVLFKFLRTPIEYQGKNYQFYNIIKPYLIKEPNSDGFRLKNGSRLLIVSLNKSGAQGRTINVIHIEELDKLGTEQSKREALAGIINSIRKNKEAKIRICCNNPTGIFRLLKAELYKYGHYFYIFAEDVFNPEDDYSGMHTIINEDVIVAHAPKLDQILKIFSEVLVSYAFAEAQLYNIDDVSGEVFNPEKMEIAYNKERPITPIYKKTTMGIDPGGKIDAFGVSIWSLTMKENTHLRWCKRYFNAKHNTKEQAKEIAHMYIDFNVEACQAESSAGSPWTLNLISHYVNKYSKGTIRFNYYYVNFEGEGKVYDKNNFVYMFKILLDYGKVYLYERDKEERALHHQLTKYIVNKSESNNNPDDLAECTFHCIWILLGGFNYIKKLIDKEESPIGATTQQ